MFSRLWLRLIGTMLASVLGVFALWLLAAELVRPRLPYFPAAAEDSNVQQTAARSVVLVTDRPCFFHGDGEILGPAPVEIEVMPGAVKVLAAAE